MEWNRSVVFCLAAALGILASEPASFSGQIYQWVDQNGTVGFTDDPLNIPEKYRAGALLESASPAPIQEPGLSANPSQLGENPPPIVGQEQTDDGGHDRAYWQDRLNELRNRRAALEKRREQLDQQISATSNPLIYNQADQKARRQQLVDERAEVDADIKEVDHQINDVLPDEARRLNTPPGWLR